LNSTSVRRQAIGNGDADPENINGGTVNCFEVNFDGIVGPTHNYAGLSWGNLASTRHVGQTASPRQAALQGLEKMLAVWRMGIRQAVLPPLRRPRIDVLRDLGFGGDDQSLIETAWRHDPALVAACFSASGMWTANAATVSPSSDCADGRLHLTPANLSSSLHRSIEAGETFSLLQAIFADRCFCVHPPLPAGCALADEGAANHTRLGSDDSRPGVELFVFGQSVLNKNLPRPSVFPARQTLEASQAVARRHQLDRTATLFVQQHPAAIDAGVFHNDVISVGNRNLLLVHEQAFLESDSALGRIAAAFRRTCGSDLILLQIRRNELSLDDAVNSYLFNSQLLTRPDGKMTLLCPSDVDGNKAARQCVTRILECDNPVDNVQFMDLRQSMNNGGGPACLRLRVVMNEEQWQRVHQGVLFDESLYVKLRDWIEENYREELRGEDLCDPGLLAEIDKAFAGLAAILELPRRLFRMPD
jgi:succinylarginine dihydrolase